MERVRELEKIKLPLYPTFFLCTGVSGAGCTTALNQVCEAGLAELAPAQFTTRALRNNEKRGKPYYSVTPEVLNKVWPQITLQDHYGENTYGIFYPAVRKIQKILQNRNVIIDSTSLPDKWRFVLGEEYRITSLFFCPEEPLIALERIRRRGQQSGETSLPGYLRQRAKANAEYVKRLTEYDYWVDTTHLENVFSVVESIIKVESWGIQEKHQKLKPVFQFHQEVEVLIEKFNKEIEDFLETCP